MPFTSNTPIKIYYEMLGEGLPLLFISGTGGDLRSKPNVMNGPLPTANKVVAYDQRGLGQTEKPGAEYTMAQYADDAAALMDELDWPQANIVGVSFGGMVAQHLVARHPGRIRKLVLCCTSPGGPELSSYPLHELPEDLDERQRISRLMSINDTRHDTAWQVANAAKVEQLIDNAIAMRHEDQQLKAFKTGARKQLIARSHHDAVLGLTDITMPTLICAGRYDALAPLNNQHVMAEKIPNSQLEWFEGGHMFLIQDKAAWPTINTFLNLPG
ncbi:MAG: alpha/beta hydrolase [Pseudomonadales bacterium]|nr:alpha/beta hydrolase [Pseudomonadales bacterium]